MKKKILCFLIIILCVNFSVYSETCNNDLFIKNYILYEKSKIELKKQHFKNAIFILEKIKKNKDMNVGLDKVYINLIYAYYKNFNLNMAKKNIKKFIKLYPNHLNIDYIVYLNGLIDIEMDKNTFLKILSIYYHKNDPIYAINAFFELKNFIYHYPKSLYVINAKKHLMYLKNRLSQHEFNILKFYFFNKKYISVINRGEEIIQKYPETKFAQKSLIYIKKSYLALKIFNTAKKISKIILLNKIS